MLDLKKPLKRSQKIRMKDGAVVTITAKYERLPHFCFLCGRIDHTDRDCIWVAEEDRDKGCGWSLDLKASPRRGLSKARDELAYLKTKKKLFTFKPKPQNHEKITSSIGVTKGPGTEGINNADMA